MAQHKVMLTVSNGVVTPAPFPITNLNPGDEVIWKLQNANANQSQIMVTYTPTGVKIAVLDTAGTPLIWSIGGTGVNLPPPPPPPDVRTMIEL
ncbi:MAG TPA: hypothetical protein VF789_06745 [Thermoanaerobaculia bacterium]